MAFGEVALTWEECVKEAVEYNPDLVSSREKLNQIRADRSIVRSGLLPQVTTQASGRRSNCEKP